MKKLFLIAALMFAAVGAFADDFDMVVQLEQQAGEKGGFKVRGDKEYGVIFYDIKLSADTAPASPEELAEAKKEFLKIYRRNAGPNGIAILKKLSVSLIVNFIYTDYTILSIVITPDEL